MNKIERVMEKSMELSDEMISNFKEVLVDAEALLKATANQGGEELSEVRAKTEKSLRIAKAKLAENQSLLLAKTKAAARATDVYVHENPWKAIGGTAGAGVVAGVVIGLLIGRR